MKLIFGAGKTILGGLVSTQELELDLLSRGLF